MNAEGHEHWICRNCHTLPPKPKKPKGHLLKTTAQTSGPIYHLGDSHGVVALGATPVERPPTPLVGSRQASITGFTSSSGVRTSDAPFDYNVFKGLLLQLFTTRPVPLALVEDDAFRSLLTHCQPALHHCIPSRRSLRRYIDAPYNSSFAIVESYPLFVGLIVSPLVALCCTLPLENQGQDTVTLRQSPERTVRHRATCRHRRCGLLHR